MRDIDARTDEIALNVRELLTRSDHTDRLVKDNKSRIKRLESENKKHRNFRSRVKGEMMMFKIVISVIGVLAAIAVVVVMIVK